MALDYSDFAATEEEAATHRTAPYKPEKGREKMLARIERTIRQVKNDIGMQGGSDIKRLHSNGIEYRPTLNGVRIYLTDKTEEFFETTSEKIEKLLDRLKGDVEAGHFDEQIKGVLSGRGKTTSRARPGKAKSGVSADKPWTTRKGWDELSEGDKKAIQSRHRFGKNPDNSLIAEVGHKPDAPLDPKRKKA